MIEFNIVAAREDQMHEVAQLYTESLKRAMPNLPQLHSLQEDQDYFKDVVFKNTHVLLVESAKDQRLLGFISFKGQVIYHLYIDTEEQRQGLGTALLRYAQSNSPALQLWSFQKNTIALNFYKKHEFQIEQETNGQDNELQEPDYLLCWSNTKSIK